MKNNNNNVKGGNTYTQIYLREEKILCEVKGGTTY
jgi:hypothetical protein